MRITKSAIFSAGNSNLESGIQPQSSKAFKHVSEVGCVIQFAAQAIMPHLFIAEIHSLFLEQQRTV